MLDIETPVPDAPATSAPLTPAARGMLPLVMKFFRDHDHAIYLLIGQQYGYSRRREELIRVVADAYALGRPVNLTQCMHKLKGFGARKAIRADIDLLVDRDLFVLLHQSGNRRVIQVWPTARLIDWYNDVLLKLAFNTVAAVDALVSRLAIQPPDSGAKGN